MNRFEHVFELIGEAAKKAFSWLISSKAKSALDTAAHLVERAAPIVETIGSIVLKGTAEEALEAGLKFGVTLSETELNSGPYAVGNALLNLATDELKKVAPGFPVNVLQTAIQMAVTAYRANHPTALSPV